MPSTHILNELSAFYGPHFPRRFASMSKGMMTSWDVADSITELFDKMWGLNGYCNLYSRVYGEEQIAKHIFDRFYFDFDSVNILEARNDAIKFYNYIVDEFGGQPLVLESGSKGYNIYVFTEPVYINNYGDVVREFGNEIEEALNLTTLDHSPLGDINRLSRIPYSINLKSNRLCRPVRFDNHENVLVTDDTSYRYCNINTLLRTKDEKFDSLYQSESYVHLESEKAIEGYDSELVRILKHMARMPAVQGNGWKRAMFALVAPRMVKVYGLKESIKLMNQWLQETNNLSERSFCIYQLEYAHKKKSIPWRIDTFLAKNPDLRRFWSMF